MSCRSRGLLSCRDRGPDSSQHRSVVATPEIRRGKTGCVLPPSCSVRHAPCILMHHHAPCIRRHASPCITMHQHATSCSIMHYESAYIIMHHFRQPTLPPHPNHPPPTTTIIPHHHTPPHPYTHQPAHPHQVFLGSIRVNTSARQDDTPIPHLEDTSEQIHQRNSYDAALQD